MVEGGQDSSRGARAAAPGEPQRPRRRVLVSGQPAEIGSAAARPSYPIESVDNALRLLLMFREHRSIRVSEAGRAISVAGSTAHRLLAMLSYHGFVRQDPASRAYVAGPTLIDIGLSAVRDLDIRILARPFAERLSERTNETVHVAALQGPSVLYLDSVESQQPLRVASRTGTLLPAYATSVGKALLSELPTKRLRTMYRAQLKPLTATTIPTRALLEKELAVTRARGYALNLGEAEEGVHSIGVVVRDPGGHARAALSVSAPATRFDDERAAEFARLAGEEASVLGSRLG
jgi:IclR family transcriptional regulator, acetate operon repressor